MKMSKRGYTVEVDLDYQYELHDLYNDYPLAPEKLRVRGEWFSTYQNDLIKSLYATGYMVSKLVPNLMTKERYV